MQDHERLSGTASIDGQKLDIAVREARPDEWDTVRELTLAAYAEYEFLFPSAFWENYRPNIESTLRDDTAAQRLVAAEGNTLLGSVMYYPPHAKPPRPGRLYTGWPEVRLLAVTPQARGRGLGRLLMEECVRRARRGDAAALLLHTMSAMSIAQQLYERMGFVRDPRFDFEPVEELEVFGYTLDLGREM